MTAAGKSLPSAAARPARKRVRLSSEARRRQLLEIGLDLFGRRPYGEVSIDEIAQAAGVAHGTVYHHFPDKSALYRAMLADIGRRLAAVTDPDPSLPPHEQLLVGLRAHVQFASEFPDAYRALMTGGNGGDRKLYQLVERARWRALNPIVRALGVGEPEPRLRLVLRGWSSFNDGLVIEWLRKRDLPAEEVAELMGEALFALLNAVEPRPGEEHL